MSKHAQKLTSCAKRRQKNRYDPNSECEINKYVRPRNTRTEMYADRVACCPLVSHVEYAPRALLRLEKRQDRQTDGRQTITLRLPLHTASVGLIIHVLKLAQDIHINERIIEVI